jgi:hypothetical protein
MAKKIDPFKAKQRKQKILAGVLGVGLLGVLAFQVPRVMKQLNPPPTPSVSGGATTTTAAPPPGTPTLAAPTLQGAQPTSAPTTPNTGSLVSSPAPPVQDGVLASFSRFASKDPFAPQIHADNGGSSGAKGSSGGSGSSSGGSTPPPPGVSPAPGSAVITVNGTAYDVAVGTDFPQASPTDPTIVPLFHLVSLTASTGKISIVGGSYSSGARTVTLKVNKPVTLMNTADGTRYTLVLKPQGASVPDATDPTTTTTVELPPATP